jgi:hypothetical protein
VRSFEFDNPLATPCVLKQTGCDPSDIHPTMTRNSR